MSEANVTSRLRHLQEKQQKRSRNTYYNRQGFDVIDVKPHMKCTHALRIYHLAKFTTQFSCYRPYRYTDVENRHQREQQCTGKVVGAVEETVFPCQRAT